MEPLKHECGVAMIRLRKPLEYYQEKYGTWQYGLNKLYLLMEKQHNRGQEGAGVACVKLEAQRGEEFMFRERALGSGAITECLGNIHHRFNNYSPSQLSDARFAKSFIPYAGEIYMGHLRYSTTGKSGLSYVHPFLRRNNWRARNLLLCGNFNLTNVDEIFAKLSSKGQHPRLCSDTFLLLEQLGHRLDRESERVFSEGVSKGYADEQITEYIERNIDVFNILATAATDWDGGYVICGATGSGEMFTLRDPHGIRPCFWYADDEVVVVASERPVIQTTFNLEAEEVNELAPGEALNVSRTGELHLRQLLEAGNVAKCVFERIYFSRGSDRDIYKERKALGLQLVDPILKAIDGDLRHSVFSFIPNTAEVAFYGMLEGLKQYLNLRKIDEIEALDHKPTHQELERILNQYVRSEKVAIKDIKLRTFITENASRNELAAHVYDITYGAITPYADNLVVIDDSIVRGTTLRESILRILNRLHPKKIVVVSSSPQVRYPDYYGIDMANMDEFIAFRAAIELLKENGQESVITEVYRQCVRQLDYPDFKLMNPVKEIYRQYSDADISRKIVEMLRPDEVGCPIEMVFQPIAGLRAACPDFTGDWYFTGDYPTPGGLRLLHKAFIDYYENRYK